MNYFFNIEPFLKGRNGVLNGQKIKLLLILMRFTVFKFWWKTNICHPSRQKVKNYL